MSKKPQNQLQESKRAFKEMKADLQKVAAKMQNLDRKENYGLIKVAREQGELVDVVMSKPDRYGTNSVELLAAYLGRKADWLYKLKRLFRAFDDESMGILFQQGREKNAKPLTLSHLILLGAITGKPMPFIMSLAKKASMQH
jgi:hypothetical protein